MEDGKELCTLDGYCPSPSLISHTYGQIKGAFDSTLLSAADTYELVGVTGNESIALTDLIVSAEKKNAGTITIQFNDGTYTEGVVLATVTDAPINLAIPFVGHWQGWRAAYLEVITSEAIAGCVAVGYFKLPEDKSLTYSEWDAMR
jgi:hypothetical protein